MVEYLENLEITEGDREMYKSIFERVYTERGREEGIERGIERGIEKGIEKGKLEMAKNLLARGISPDIIAESSGLSQNDIQSLMNS
jgi:predicted transposase/invertase (TIGR01784 family)